MDTHKQSHAHTESSSSLSRTSETPTVTLGQETDAGTPTPADRPAETGTLWHLDSTSPRTHTQPPTQMQMCLHTQTPAGMAHMLRTSALSHARAHTDTQAAGPSPLFPGPCCHTVETQRPPQRPLHPTQHGLASHVDEKTKIWLGRERWVVRREGADEIIILLGLFISVIISGAFTRPHRPLPADPA